MLRSLIRHTKMIVASLAASTLIVGAVFSPAVSEASDFTSAAASETGSAVTIKASDYDLNYTTAPLPDLEVTISQTKDLSSQGVLVSWTGGKASVPPSNGGGENFMQIFQCWGEDPKNPGHPDRTTCQYGAYGDPASSRFGGSPLEAVHPNDMEFTKISDSGALEPYTSIPFKSATGETLWDLEKDAYGKVVNASKFVSMTTNEFYSAYTTNETRWAGSDPSGNGSSKFEVQTASESPGLGCGNQQKVDGKVIGQSCWLVVLPRGIKDNGREDISSSGLFWDAWQHAIAVKMSFVPIGFTCEIGVAEQQVQGSELVNEAFGSWQPSLCGGKVKRSFVLSNSFDGDAVQAAVSAEKAPVISVTTGAIDDVNDSGMIYTPTALAGVSISFSIDRILTQAVEVPSEIAGRSGKAFESLKLTPRLLAKLITASYKSAIPFGVDSSYLGTNPNNLVADPEFKATNSSDGDWEFMNISGTSVSDALMPSSRSLLAQALWKYILADKEAADFMSGKPDDWGMKVNPWYSTSASINPTGTGLNLPSVTFPKSDPIEKPNTVGQENGSGPVNLVAWRPYLQDFTAGAANVLRGQSLLLGPWNPNGTPPAFGKSSRVTPGSQSTISITVSPAASLYQNVQVSLQNPAGEFIAPTLKSLSAAGAAMTASEKNPQIVEFNFSSKEAKSATEAYPLTVPIYLGVNTQAQDKSSLAVFANMLQFITDEGQTLGEGKGQLPQGYAPLNSRLADDAKTAIGKIKNASKEVEQAAEPQPLDPEPVDNEVKIIAAGATPQDPSLPLSSFAVPASSAVLICASMFYALLIRRKSIR
ncbi:MAG: hypothetical protein EBY26_03570 [Microbacteriaceae bacterium]|nr:hypothetical protein [Microbacteriaceae bacterium]